MPNNRQLALLIWLVVLIAWILCTPKARASVRGLARIGRSPKFIIPLASMIGWTVGLVAIGAHLDFWDASLTSDTIFWFATAGLVVFFNINKVPKERHYFRTTFASAFGLTLAVEVFSELVVLSLIAEILLVPLLALLAGLAAVATRNREHRQVEKLARELLTAVSLCILSYVSFSLIQSHNSLDAGHIGRQFAQPVWLTLGLAPFIYGMALYASYESAFLRMDWKSDAGWWPRTRNKLVLVRTFHVRARSLDKFSGPWQLRLASAESLDEARQCIREFRNAHVDLTDMPAEDGRLWRPPAGQAPAPPAPS